MRERLLTTGGRTMDLPEAAVSKLQVFLERMMETSKGMPQYVIDYWHGDSIAEPELAPIVERQAAASKLWSLCYYGFAFRNTRTMDWEAQLNTMLEEQQRVDTWVECYASYQRFMATLHDGHSMVHLPKWLRTSTGTPSAEVKYFDGDWWCKVDDCTAPIRIVSIDGVPLEDVLSRKRKLVSSSTQHALMRDLGACLLTGPISTHAHIEGVDIRGNVKKLVLARESGRIEHPISVEFTANIALIRIKHFNSRTVLEQLMDHLPMLLKQRGWVIDLRDNRGGSGNLAMEVMRLITNDTIYTARTRYTTYTPVLDTFGLQQISFGPFQEIVPSTSTEVYRGPVAVLTDAGTYSCAEDFVLWLQTHQRGKVFGSPTSGSTGNSSYLPMPGGGLAQVCVQDDRRPDDTPFVGIGLYPDVYVPTVLDDWVNGVDRVFAEAVMWINKS